MDNTNEWEDNGKIYIVWGVVFAVAVIAIVVWSIIAPDKTYSATEKRNLASGQDVVQCIKRGESPADAAEKYMADQFPGRNNIVAIKASMERFMGKVRFNDVYVCDNGYMMQDFAKPDAGNISETYEQMKEFASRYPESSFYMMLVPNAISVYRDYLPDYVEVRDQNEFIDDAYTNIGNNIDCIDVRPVLKGDGLYYRTDHHWTTDAAYLAYGLLADEMRLDLEADYESGVVCSDFKGSLASRSGYAPLVRDNVSVYYQTLGDKVYYTVTYEDSHIREGTCYRPDRLTGANPYEVFFGGDHSAITIDTSADTDRTLIVFKDSYANCLIPFLIPQFKKIKIVDPRHFYDDIDMVMQSEKFTDVLFLYNVNTFSQDTVLKVVLANEQQAE